MLLGAISINTRISYSSDIDGVWWWSARQSKPLNQFNLHAKDNCVLSINLSKIIWKYLSYLPFKLWFEHISRVYLHIYQYIVMAFILHFDKNFNLRRKYAHVYIYQIHIINILIHEIRLVLISSRSMLKKTKVGCSRLIKPKTTK